MLLKLLLKIWPSFLPIISYVLWVSVVENIILKRLLTKKNTIEGETVIGEKSTKKGEEEVQKISKFSLQNRHFVIVLYLTLILAIATLIYSAFI